MRTSVVRTSTLNARKRDKHGRKAPAGPCRQRTTVIDSALPMSILCRNVGRLLVALACSCAGVSAAGAASDEPAARAPKGAASSSVSAAAPTASADPVIVVGIVGGWIRADNHDDHIVQLADRLNREYGPGVHAEIFENHHREQARERILTLLDTDRSGTLEAGEKQQARIVLYGESWGGSETVMLARELKERGIPVMLTVQIDSVAKIGENDEVAPANVVEAVNFYQPHGIIHGCQAIRAEDASRTQVIGNFRFDYEKHPVPVRGASWFAKTFLRPHVSIENDPAVWRRIETLIRSELPAPAAQQQVAADAR